MRGDPERLEPNAVARRLVVEAEALAGVPDLMQSARELDPARLARPDRSERPKLAVGRLQGIARKQMLRVRENQLLVLLLVLQAELDQPGDLGRKLRIEHREHGRIDVIAIHENLAESGAREH